MLFKTWLRTYIILANALVMQGSNRAYEIISILFEIIDRNNLSDPLLICKTKLALAFANTLKGDIKSSQAILNEIIQNNVMENLDNEILANWNIINILNKFICKTYTNLNQDLFQVVAFANNINDQLTKNVLKTFLGKYLKDTNKLKQSLEIYNEELSYFSQERNATGAMLCWYLISELNMKLEGPDKALSVAIKALDVAKNPRINSYLFIVLYNKIIAEMQMQKGDYENAKISIEKAIMFARKFEMQNLLANLYLLYGRYLQDLTLTKTDSGVAYMSNAFKMYKKAYSISKEINNEVLSNEVIKATNALKSFCQLNRIHIR